MVFPAAWVVLVAVRRSREAGGRSGCLEGGGRRSRLQLGFELRRGSGSRVLPLLLLFSSCPENGGGGPTGDPGVLRPLQWTPTWEDVGRPGGWGEAPCRARCRRQWACGRGGQRRVRQGVAAATNHLKSGDLRALDAVFRKAHLLCAPPAPDTIKLKSRYQVSFFVMIARINCLTMSPHQRSIHLSLFPSSPTPSC